MKTDEAQDPIAVLRSTADAARSASRDLSEATSREFVKAEEAAWSAVSAAIEAVEGERKMLRSALSEIRGIVDFEFGEMKRKREIMDPLAHSGDIARRALTEPSHAE